MSGVAIRWGVPQDADALAELLRDNQAHYRQEQTPPEKARRIAERLLRAQPGEARYLLCLVDGTPAGFACAASVSPAPDLGSALYVKEFYVRSGMRNAGVGPAMLAFLAQHCRAEGLARIDLTTEDWNEGAIRFYEREGGKIQRQKVAIRFDREALERLADKGQTKAM